MKITDLYESDFLTNEDEIIKWMTESFDNFNLKYLKIESDGLVYNYYLCLTNYIDKLKVQFKSVTNSFYCKNTNITSLEGCPKSVGEYFSCESTKITTLKFCPISVVRNFTCYNTNIIDPKEYRFALYSEIGGKFESRNAEIDEIINTYKGSANRKYWPHAINLLSKVKL